MYRSLFPTPQVISVYLRQIRRLASGRVELDDPGPQTVSRSDLLAALSIAEGIEGEVAWLRFPVDELGDFLGVPLQEIKSRGRGGVVAELTYGIFADNVSKLRRVIELHASRATADQLTPVPLVDIVRFDYFPPGIEEVLMVLSGQLSWENSTFAEITREFEAMTKAVFVESADLILSAIPVIGPVYDVSTSVIGYRLPDGKRLTNAERAMRIGFLAVGAAVSALARFGRVTLRTWKLERAGAAIGALSAGDKRGRIALALALNRLQPRQAQRLKAIIKVALSSSRSLTHEEQLILYRLIKITNDRGIAMHWRRLASLSANLEKTGIGSAKVMKDAAKLQPGEREAIEILSAKFKEPIIKLPEQVPQRFGIRTQVANAKHPDLAIGEALADIYTPRTSNLDKILQEMASKASQGTVVVVNMNATKVTAETLKSSMHKLWGKPAVYGLTKVIVLDSKGYFEVVTRELRFEPIDLVIQSATSGSGRGIEEAMDEWDAMEAEAAASQ